MAKHKAEEHRDMTSRLRHLEQFLAPKVMTPRTPSTDEQAPALPAVQRRTGRMYVIGHEPHFRPVTLLKPARSPRQDGPDAT